jgi:hypothetical protein
MKEKICFECVHYQLHPRDIWCGDCIHNGEPKKDNFRAKEEQRLRDGRPIFIINE